MIAIVIISVLVLVEVVFTTLSIIHNSDHKIEKSIVSVLLFSVFILIVITPIVNWGFQWYMPGLVLGIQSLLGISILIRKKLNSVPKKSKLLFTGLNRVFILVIAMLPSLIFPQHTPIEPTGKYSVSTISYTLTDESREEYFTTENDYRKLTIQYWYPKDVSGPEGVIAGRKFPLVIFSHGAFGYRMSNYSTYHNLASNGYIVASIDHTYHAFMTKQEDGKTIIANMDFINSAMGAQMGKIEAEKVYELENEWMKLRTGDMKFILDYIRKTAASSGADPLYKSMDLEHIGVFGHSMGGAAAASIGRYDIDVDAVIVIDGTMMGEITGFENGREIVTNTPYPKPLMNIYSEYHYNGALASEDVYPNMVAGRNAIDSYQVVIKGSGHMNFTDLPVISPFLSKLLETGDKNITVDPRYCIETMNADILQFFDRYLKNSSAQISKVRFQ